MPSHCRWQINASSFRSQSVELQASLAPITAGLQTSGHTGPMTREEAPALEGSQLSSPRGLLQECVLPSDQISVSTSQWSEERALMHLVLTTLAGDEAQLTIET